MEPYQTRVVEEKAELDAKMDKLTSFIDTQFFGKCSQAEQELLVEQLHHMGNYTAVLAKRIRLFGV